MMTKTFGEFSHLDEKGVDSFKSLCAISQVAAVWIELHPGFSNIFWETDHLPDKWKEEYRDRMKFAFTCEIEGAYRICATAQSFLRVYFFSGKALKIPSDVARKLAGLIFELLEREVGRARRRAPYL